MEAKWVETKESKTLEFPLSDELSSRRLEVLGMLTEIWWGDL